MRPRPSPASPSPPRPAKRALDGAAEARLAAIACSGPPAGRDRWALSLLAGRMVELKYVEAVSEDAVRRAPKKTRPSRG